MGEQLSADLFKAEVAERFGVLPNFFCTAASAPDLIEKMWSFAKSGYLDNPLPSLFKERLFVHLSRFCGTRYCIVRHVGFLIGEGRPAGDAVLRGVARLLLENVRAGDVACRFGGDEFIILMPGASLDAATRKAQGVECSTGVAIYPDHGSSAAELLKSADAELYRAKAAGGARGALG